MTEALGRSLLAALDACTPLFVSLVAAAFLGTIAIGGWIFTPAPLAFKTGLFHLSRAHPNVECVPVWLDNIGRALPKGVAFPIPVSASALIGAPVAPEPAEDRDAFLARARMAVVELGRSLRPDMPSEPPDA